MTPESEDLPADIVIAFSYGRWESVMLRRRYIIAGVSHALFSRTAFFNDLTLRVTSDSDVRAAVGQTSHFP